MLSITNIQTIRTEAALEPAPRRRDGLNRQSHFGKNTDKKEGALYAESICTLNQFGIPLYAAG